MAWDLKVGPNICKYVMRVGLLLALPQPNLSRQRELFYC